MSSFVTTLLAATVSTNLEDVALANHEAIRIVKSYCALKGYDADALALEESKRIEGLTWAEYRKLPRVGSTFQLNRATRLGLFVAYYTNKAAKALTYS